ncbi:hypothetical protein [Jannaschia aquimarina]|uniref:Uncharacterized protein n=1 Tax=Jannaschia aquimarina TaxID=935700 RepID=A0A0D1ER45_9RHOB|nr:hypothetical protein [Jannaschia aquimarina]KIT18105.1 hypothetical protein jaqu_01250 [Jannaschia aquimarina]SNT40899.1 hypothetical protein SAMN05421775_11622 [Jannaschia aquimarina]
MSPAPSDPSAWPSFAHQLALAERLYGSLGRRRVEDWLGTQVGRIGSAEFARLFSDHIDLPGVAPFDYAHRHVRVGGRSLIGGIRFYGHDIERPFVEVIAHDFAGSEGGATRLGPESLAKLADAVASEWSAFGPLHMRLRVPPDAPVPPNAHIDTHVFVARYSDMAPPDGRVRLTAFADPDEAMAMVRERFTVMERDEPALRRNVSPIEPDYLTELHGEGRVHAIVSAALGRASGEAEENLGAPVGLLAVAPGGVDWIDGDEVMEEVVTVEHAGHGYAASAQAAFATLPGNDPTALLVGTIDVLNVASRRTAERAGRANVMDYLFVDLPTV